MNHQGHGLALKHSIFNHPNAVVFPSTKTPREKQYEDLTSPLYPEGMGETYEVVDFEVSKPDGWNPTIVSHEGFFTDVPGFENLAEGCSGKMIGSLSLARQGRYFYWGYSIDPQRLTDPAQGTLENVIHYMSSKRHSLTVPFACTTRRSLWIYLELNRRVGYLRGIEEHFLGTVQEESRQGYVATPEGLKAWLDENLAYVFSGKTPSHKGTRYTTVFEVDTDAKVLKTPNGERASLETWIQLAGGEDKEKSATAEDLLERYVHPDIAPASVDGRCDWAAWYERSRDRIVFVDSAGFWWIEDPRVLEREQRQARALSGQ